MIRAAVRAATSGARTAALAICALANLAACAPPTGDLGRQQPSVVHDALMPAAGRHLAYARGEPASFYRWTDDERLMRDLAWGIVMPPLDAQRLERTLVELRRTRILPADRVRIDKASYVETLLSTDYRSSVARYARLKEDIDADVTRIEPFFVAAARVVEDDRVRARAAERVPELRPDERENVDARIDENRLLIAWARESLDERIVAYRYALDRLVIETPDRAAIEVETALAVLERVLASLRPLGHARGVFKG